MNDSLAELIEEEWPNDYNISKNNNFSDFISTVNASISREAKSKFAARHLLSLQIFDWFNTYYLGTFIILGVLGNLKNVVVFLRKRNKLRRSPSYYLAALALADVIFLAILFILWLGQFSIDLFSQSGIYQTLFYLSSASSCISGKYSTSKFNWYVNLISIWRTAWLVAAFTFERLIVVRYPLKRSIICTVRRTKLIIFCLTVTLLIVQAISLFPTGVIATTKPEERSAVNCTYEALRNVSAAAKNLPPPIISYYQLKRIFAMFEPFITLVVPPVLIVVMNSFIIHSLFKYKRTFHGADAAAALIVNGSINRHHQRWSLKLTLETIRRRCHIKVSLLLLQIEVIMLMRPASIDPR